MTSLMPAFGVSIGLVLGLRGPELAWILLSMAALLLALMARLAWLWWGPDKPAIDRLPGID